VFFPLSPPSFSVFDFSVNSAAITDKGIQSHDAKKFLVPLYWCRLPVRSFCADDANRLGTGDLPEQAQR
jgi:hypothetical protein